MNKSVSILLQISLCVFAAVLISILIVKRFYYYGPLKEMMDPWIPVEDISIGHLYGWILRSDSDKVVLFFHGNAGNISHRQEKMSMLNKLGYNVVIFDYSGFGNSTGVPSQEQLYHDGMMFTKRVQEEFKNENIIFWGESMGAAVAVHTAQKMEDVDEVIVVLDAGLPGIKPLVDYHYPILKPITMLFRDFDTTRVLFEHNVKNKRRPYIRTLCIHSSEDEVVAYGCIAEMRTLADVSITTTGTHMKHNIPWETVGKILKEWS